MGPRKLTACHAFLALLWISASLLSSIHTTNASTHRGIEVTASQFQFEPGRITVNHGDTVTFKVKSGDVTHGFYIDGYGIDREVKPGDEVEVTITADKVGKFKIRCSSTCGPLHPFMVGELIVEQGGINYTFLSSASVIAVVGIAAMLLAWRRD